MKVTVDLKLKKFLTLARIKGDLDVSAIAEPATKGVVRNKIVDSFKQSGLTGTINFDGEEVEL